MKNETVETLATLIASFVTHQALARLKRKPKNNAATHKPQPYPTAVK